MMVQNCQKTLCVWRPDQRGRDLLLFAYASYHESALRITKEEWLTVTCHQSIQQISRYVGDETHKSELQSHRERLVLGLHAPVNMKSKAMKT
jgi:hypothetical protein